ncbi:RES family NAD+ phosphorylase [Rhodovulum sp. P5]|uniref:RES family NAD+ phosphorylase n=1 Tax=Rhodovulum sp. P5 TaxID=1564506 RepID=UPI0009D9E7F6
MAFEDRLQDRLKQRTLANEIRIVRTAYSATPLQSVPYESRYCDGKDPKYAVTYFADSLTTAFAEVLVRGRYSVRFGSGGVYERTRSIRFTEINSRSVVVANSSAHARMTLVDLTGPGLAYLGLHTDLSRAGSHTRGRRFSRFIYENYSDVDGFIWESRHTIGECICIFDRAIHKAESSSVTPLLKHPDLPSVLSTLSFSISAPP